MNITYLQNGDYQIPDIAIRKTKPIGHYGRLRKAYLEAYGPILYNEQLIYDKLYDGVTEKLKAENQMEWVRQMNACKAQAEAIVKFELIYD